MVVLIRVGDGKGMNRGGEDKVDKGMSKNEVGGEDDVVEGDDSSYNIGVDYEGCESDADSVDKDVGEDKDNDVSVRHRWAEAFLDDLKFYPVHDPLSSVAILLDLHLLLASYCTLPPILPVCCLVVFSVNENCLHCCSHQSHFSLVSL